MSGLLVVAVKDTSHCIVDASGVVAGGKQCYWWLFQNVREGKLDRR